MNLAKIPATVVTGFLGSGKTTLLSHVIRQAGERRIAVIVNEFGELDIDAELLRCPLECDETGAAPAEDGIYELANGCICCTVEEEFLPVMERLMERRQDLDHILIETSGLALPKPLVQAFNWPQIRQHCTVDAVITVVDGPAVAAGRFAHDPQRVAQLRAADANLDHDPSLQELLEDQLTAADLVVISKRDLVAADDMKRVEARVRDHIAAETKIIEVSHGQIATEMLIGLQAASEDRIENISTHHDHHHAHDQHHQHAHEEFDSFSLTFGEVDSAQLVAAVNALIKEMTIYRVKGFLALPDKPMRQVIQGVGTRLSCYFDRRWRADEPRQSRLVFIGRDLNPEQLRAKLAPAQR